MADFAHSQAASEHEQEHRSVSGTGDDGKELLQVGILDVARQALAQVDEMPLRDNWIFGRGFGFNHEKVVERAQGRQAPVDGRDGVALRQAVLDEGVDVLHLDYLGRLAEPSEEQVEVITVMDGRAGVRSFAPQPSLETFDFW